MFVGPLLGGLLPLMDFRTACLARGARAGLADSAGVSYEAYNLPGRYIRHYNYLLYIQAVSTTTDRADATFYTQ